MSARLLDTPSKDRLTSRARTHRLVVRVDDVTHEIIKLDVNTLSVTLACEPCLGVLVDPDTIVYEHGEVDVDCMSCLVKRSWL